MLAHPPRVLDGAGGGDRPHRLARRARPPRPRPPYARLRPLSGAPMAACPFCAIVSGDGQAHVVLDDGDVMGFLDARPVFPGHVLVVPRRHPETLADLPAIPVPA